ncbi:MAG TPA: outer membrane beta-barrel protein, partial [Bradyrhizobium sp.]|nr:outer membrane beta-barrel protein [Bradyrhizobium sp.]
MWGPATGRRERALTLRALLPCLALIALGGTPARAQTMTPDLFRPVPGGFVSPQDLPMRRTAIGGGFANDGSANNGTSDDGSATLNGIGSDSLRGIAPAPSRIGQIPEYGVPAASGASDTGFDSLNRTRKQPKYYPAQARPKPPPGPGSSPPTPPPVTATGDLRLSIPPSDSASKPPLPPAMAGTVEGQPPRKRLKVDDDPFGAVGDYYGSFLVKSAVEVSGGYNSNPGRTDQPKGLPFWVVAPEFLAVSDWDRHALVADLRGSFTGYGGTLPLTDDNAVSPAPPDVSQPSFTGHVDGRIDVSNTTHLTAEARLNVATDNPGSPNIQAGLARYPLFAVFGGTLGIDQSFNRLDVAAGATFDRTAYQNSTLTDGTTSSNDDRNFNQTGGVARVSYEVSPAVKPFVEVEGDTRVHDLQYDRNGYDRDSTGGYAEAGTSFEFTRLLTGEISVGYEARNYVDPRLNRLDGLLTAASLVWTATPLTTGRFNVTTSIDETTLPGASGVLTHLYTFEVDHDFRRWLTAIGKFTFGTMDYQGYGRTDQVY